MLKVWGGVFIRLACMINSHDSENALTPEARSIPSIHMHLAPDLGNTNAQSPMGVL